MVFFYHWVRSSIIHKSHFWVIDPAIVEALNAVCTCHLPAILPPFSYPSFLSAKPPSSTVVVLSFCATINRFRNCLHSPSISQGFIPKGSSNIVALYPAESRTYCPHYSFLALVFIRPNKPPRITTAQQAWTLRGTFGSAGNFANFNY